MLHVSFFFLSLQWWRWWQRWRCETTEENAQKSKSAWVLPGKKPFWKLVGGFWVSAVIIYRLCLVVEVTAGHMLPSFWSFLSWEMPEKEI